MKAQSADKMKAVVTEIVNKVCPGFAWADGEVLVIERFPFKSLYIEVVEEVILVGFYTRVYGISLPDPIFAFYISDWKISGFSQFEEKVKHFERKFLERGNINKTVYNKILRESEEIAEEIELNEYAKYGKVKKHHHL